MALSASLGATEQEGVGVRRFPAPKAEPLPTSGRHPPSQTPGAPGHLHWRRCSRAGPAAAHLGPLVDRGAGARMWAVPGPTQLACSGASSCRALMSSRTWEVGAAGWEWPGAGEG